MPTTTAPPTPLQVKGYLASRGYLCPYCNGPDLSCGDHEAAGTNLYLQVSCRECHSSWSDVYELRGVAVDGQAPVFPPED